MFDISINGIVSDSLFFTYMEGLHRPSPERHFSRDGDRLWMRATSGTTVVGRRHVTEIFGQRHRYTGVSTYGITHYVVRAGYHIQYRAWMKHKKQEDPLDAAAFSVIVSKRHDEVRATRGSLLRPTRASRFGGFWSFHLDFIQKHDTILTGLLLEPAHFERAILKVM